MDSPMPAGYTGKTPSYTPPSVTVTGSGGELAQTAGGGTIPVTYLPRTPRVVPPPEAEPTTITADPGATVKVTPPAEPAPKSGVNRLLGATSGNTEGNTRAMIAILLSVGAMAIFAYMLYQLTHGHPDLIDTVNQWGGALLALTVSAVSFYFGKRSAVDGG